jgi:Cu/Ag efflux pump CusA
MNQKPSFSRQEVMEKIKELKSRMPAHSVKPSMIAELEELEELLALCLAADNTPHKDSE